MTSLLRHRRGDINPITGDIFWIYDKKCKSGERWMSPEKYKETRARTLARDAAWYERNQDEHKKNAAAWFQNNKDKVNAYHSQPLVKLARNIRCKCHHMLRKDHSPAGMEELVGCSRQQFRAWIESTFQPGMTWQNYGEWEVDHIIPFKEAKTEEDIRWLAFHKNTRALWSKQNRKKYTKIL